MKFTPRAAAAAILRDWEEGSTFIDALIDRHCTRAKLEPRDRAMAQNLALGVIRNLTLLDTWIDGLRKGKLGLEETNLLRLGLFQVLVLRSADHAAVNETVSLARPRARGLVNAVLRRAVRERDALLTDAESLPPADRYSIPDHVYARWAAAFGGEEASRIAATTNAAAEVYVRSNALRKGLSEADLTAAEAEPLSAHPGFYRVAKLPAEALAAGRCYAQDPSTALAPAMLDASPGQRVLDACAAPGGKTAIIASDMHDEGELIAVDVSAARAKRLAANLERLGVSCARIEVADLATTPLPAWAEAGRFDRILLDAPCSNTGVLRRRADARWRLMPGFAAPLAQLQGRLARALLPLLKPGGRLVYSTCSIDPEENRGVVDSLLAGHPSLELTDEKLLLPGADHDGAYAAALTAN